MRSDWLDFYHGKKVLLTGHTGFKGAWMTRLLLDAGAEVTGYSLDPPTDPSLFVLADLASEMRSVKGDVRDYDHLFAVMKETRPEIVLHLAAQPIVRTSYEIPRETFEINVMGTVNLLEAVRHTDSVRSVVNVTTDKVYLNRERAEGYREDEMLDGYDPYSNSKSCSDLVTHSYRSSFFSENGPAVSTARAGNVIGGGDFAKDRLLPDCVRAMEAHETVFLRNPSAVRPFQHVLEPLTAYLMIARRQWDDRSLADAYNVGPDPGDMITTRRIAELFCGEWGEGAAFAAGSSEGPHEANLLTLNSEKIKATIGWKPRWNVEEAVRRTVEWSKVYVAGDDVRPVTEKQIREYLDGITG